MKRMMSSRFVSLGCLASVATTGLVVLLASGPLRGADESSAEPAVERARQQAKMLDELYKNAVVSITNKYDGPPAIKVAKDVFAAMEKSGWHRAKLVDASGNPQNEANFPQTPFEKRAVKLIQKGQPYYEEVLGQGTDRTLHVATIVPAVTKKCASCHGVKEGDLLGFIRYEIPIK